MGKENRGQASVERAAPAALRLRGQASVELLAYWAFFFLAFVAMLSYLVSTSQAQLASKQYEQAAQYALELGGYYDFAFRAGDGFSGTFPLHKEIMGRGYNATFQPSGNLYVEWQAPSGSVQTIVQPLISGAIEEDSAAGLDITKGFVRFENVKGAIKITQ